MSIIVKMFKKEELDHIKINVPAQYNPYLQKAQDFINASDEIRTMWQIINVNAIDRLEITDHGPIHFQIVANIALKIARMLKKNDIPLSIEENFGLSYEHGELVIFLGSLFHDLGMTINREGHEEFSLFISYDILKNELLEFLPVHERTIVMAETLHAIISHRKGGTPHTIEAGIVRVADALDMSEGRSRIPYESGKVSIHSISAAAIDQIDILPGKEKPIQININMNNSSGVFQVDELLKKKLQGSGVEKYFSIKACVNSNTEKSLVKEFDVI